MSQILIIPPIGTQFLCGIPDTTEYKVVQVKGDAPLANKCIKYTWGNGSLHHWITGTEWIRQQQQGLISILNHK